MIIDCHGHYTTEPKDLHRFRKDQTAAANAKDKAAMPPRSGLKMSDDEIRESIEANQLKFQKERGTDLTIFSPRASGMGQPRMVPIWADRYRDFRPLTGWRRTMGCQVGGMAACSSGVGGGEPTSRDSMLKSCRALRPSTWRRRPSGSSS